MLKKKNRKKTTEIEIISVQKSDLSCSRFAVDVSSELYPHVVDRRGWVPTHSDAQVSRVK